MSKNNKRFITPIYSDRYYQVKNNSKLFDSGDIIGINHIYLQSDNKYHISCYNITKHINFNMVTDFNSFYEKFDMIKETDIKLITRYLKINKICSKKGI